MPPNPQADNDRDVVCRGQECANSAVLLLRERELEATLCAAYANVLSLAPRVGAMSQRQGQEMSISANAAANSAKYPTAAREMSCSVVPETYFIALRAPSKYLLWT